MCEDWRYIDPMVFILQYNKYNWDNVTGML